MLQRLRAADPCCRLAQTGKWPDEPAFHLGTGNAPHQRQVVHLFCRYLLKRLISWECSSTACLPRSAPMPTHLTGKWTEKGQIKTPFDTFALDATTFIIRESSICGA
ncbi:hypothetical protein KCP73_07305 [Salmonella enterica subsp. enterica]|nr:hypothetical protein KCP73_07305 [Salmonella enterica subsp. enterica]